MGDRIATLLLEWIILFDGASVCQLLHYLRTLVRR
jgi:hypothetical protein